MEDVAVVAGQGRDRRPSLVCPADAATSCRRRLRASLCDQRVTRVRRRRLRWRRTAGALMALTVRSPTWTSSDHPGKYN